MNTYVASIALCACVLGLSACDRTPTAPPTAMVEKPVPTESVARVGPATDPSLPSAQSVFPPASAATADPTPGRPDGTRNPAQEAIGTPMPGQNNDHSAPVAPAKPASSP